MEHATMWTMECGRDTSSLNTNSPNFHNAPTKLCPLVPLPRHRFLPQNQQQDHHSSSSSPSSTTTNDFIPLNVASSDQSRRDVNGQTTVSSRWNPTPEQLRTLEDLYRRGTRTPTADQIQYITAHLRRYGKIEGKNVFYWFQNHKARERQKRRRQSEAAMETAARFRPEVDLSSEKECSYAVWGAGLEKAKNWMPSFRPADDTGLSDRLARWDKELHPSNAACGRVLAASLEKRVQFTGSSVVLQRGQQYSACSAEEITGLLFCDPRNPAFVRRRGLCEKDHEEVDRGSEAETSTLQLFPLKSDSAHDGTAGVGRSLMDAAVVGQEVQQADFHGQQFFHFLPLKN